MIPQAEPPIMAESIMAITTRAPQAAAQAKSLKIIDQASAEIVCLELLAIKDLLGAAHASFDTICGANYNAWQVSLAKRKEVIEPLETAEGHLKREVAQWANVQAERVREQQRALEAETRRAQEEELEAEIEHAEATGASPSEVEAIIDRPLPVVPVVAAPAPPKVQGISTRETWKGEITDVWVFMQYAVKNNRRELAELLTANAPAVGQVARAMKASVHIPGVRVWCETSVATRRS